MHAAQGDELMHEAAETNRSPLAAVHDVPREIFALRLRTEDNVSFELLRPHNVILMTARPNRY